MKAGRLKLSLAPEFLGLMLIDQEEKKRRAVQASKRWREKNWDKFLASERERYKKNREKKLLACAKRLSDSVERERHRARVRDHYRRNKGKFPAYVAARKARKLDATPAWADMSEIMKIYEKARLISLETGVPHEVDHIIPLCGKNVSGLHVHWNLQIISREENRKKANRYDECIA
jgi:hypothetical protein